ncbi:MAG: response regulator transcription factor [Chitinophagaceae bacterium]|nr:MAG: response regulator transcription factor [Chitinophagaceae bacterium]
MINILIYEDDDGLRQSLSEFLPTGGAIRVVGAFSNADSIAFDVQTLPADIILMDIDMPGTNGIEGVKIAKAIKPGISILMFTIFDDDKKIFDAICAGADGYILKKALPEKIIEALNDVYSGGAPMSPSIAKKVLHFFPRKQQTDNDIPLTSKELQVLQQLVDGNGYKQVAAALNISIETVRTHIKHIYSKLHVSSMSQAVAKAISQKIV